MRRREILGLLLATSLAGAVPSAAVAAGEASLQPFLDSFWPEVERAGIGRALFDTTFAGMEADPSVAALTLRQPEFAKPIGDYLAAQVTPARVAQGRALLMRWRKPLADIQRRFGVPASIVVAVWGLETNYGASAGGKDVIRSLATLASLGYRTDLNRAELLAALALLQSGEVSREQLRGSWAGAMGQPQFMPSSFARYAVDADQDGKRDIWTDIPDALASIANFLAQKGWQATHPWGFAVRLPRGFDVGVSRGSFADWMARSLTRLDGRPFPAHGDGILFFPAGASGPAFLVTGNYEVIKTYNFSDAYVLSVAALADRIEGAVPPPLIWPHDAPMPREARIALQTRLVELGYEVDNREGRISLVLRDIIRQAQARVSMTPDGNPTLALLQALDGVSR